MYIVAYGTTVGTNSQIHYSNHPFIAEWKALSHSTVLRNRKELIFLVLTVMPKIDKKCQLVDSGLAPQFCSIRSV